MKIYCPAKINLFLNVLGIDKDTNMHKLFLINQTVDLYDEIEVNNISSNGMNWGSYWDQNGKSTGQVKDYDGYTYANGFSHLASGLCCGISAWAAGIAIGIAGDAGARSLGQQDRVFVGMMLILIFAEALGLYGLIVALILVS